MAPHSSTLAWKIPWMEEPGRLQSIGPLRVGHDLATSLSLFTFLHWRRKWQPTPLFLPGESQGRGSLVGCRLRDRTESDMTEATQQQQQGRTALLATMKTMGEDKIHEQPFSKHTEKSKSYYFSLAALNAVLHIKLFLSSSLLLRLLKVRANYKPIPSLIELKTLKCTY